MNVKVEPGFTQRNTSIYFLFRLDEEKNYIRWIDLSIVIVVMLTLALTAHAYLVRIPKMST